MDITAVSNMDFSTAILCFFSTWACLLVFTRIRRRVFPCNFPPGPFPLPIFGNLFELGNKPHESLAELAATYGPLMTLKLGSVTAIVISSANMAKEVLQKHDQTFSGRTIPHAAQALNHHEVSMTWLPSSLQWRTLRKICATQIFTAQRLNGNEGIRLTKVEDLIDHIREESKSKHTINIGQTVFSTILNMISNTLFSIDLAPYQSKSGGEFKAIVWGVLEELGRPNFADYFPLLRPFDPQGIKRRMSVYFRKLDKLFDTIIDQRLQSKKQDASRDLLDILLHHTEENGFKLGPLDIRALLKDIFVAGTETSSSTLEWAMTELLRNPDTMTKARLELKEKINKDAPIEESDIARLPYLQAIVKETMRLHPPAPPLVPHKAECDVDICGFTVPRHAQVLVNAWAISRDPEMWINPTMFFPDRFSGSTIDFKGRDFEFIPFGAGRRICPGLPLAFRMVHWMLASLLHSFDWELEDGVKPRISTWKKSSGLPCRKPSHFMLSPSKHKLTFQCDCNEYYTIHTRVSLVSKSRILFVLHDECRISFQIPRA